jgi:signal transduction histidine kinase
VCAKVGALNAYDAPIKAESWGLLGMQERAARFGGSIALSRGVRKGTILVLHMPL